MSKIVILTFVLLCAISVAGFVTAKDADAVLGGKPFSPNNTMGTMKDERSQAQSHPGYTVHELVSGTLTLREYVSPAGVVFGMAWDGLLSPNLRYLLGSYYGQYKEVTKEMSRVHGKKSMLIQASGVVVEKWGHMRSMHGRAYAPALLPAGVSPREIR